MDAFGDYVWPRATSELILLPVTGLECVGDRLLAGEGPDLLVYNLDFGGHLRMVKRVQNLLGHYLIHGFRVQPEPKGDLDSEAMIAVFGSKGLRVVKISWGQSHLRELWRSGLWNMSDWIWDARWLEGNVALALGHNSVVLYDPVIGCMLQDVPCTDRCTLSSACLIGDTWKELTIVAGAVSNELLVWYPATALPDNKPVAPDRRVSGHVGVIFSMSYLESKGLLATASEDRSVRIWKVGDLRVPGGRVQNIGHCFGHSARVWQVKLLENYLISAGEDCVCLVWSHEGEILQAFRGHQGRGIRAIAAHERQTWVITGGDDSGIRLWHLVGRGYPGLGVSSLSFKSPSRPGALKAVTLAGSWRVLAVTDVGGLYLYDLEVKCWEQLLEDNRFQSYCLLEAAPGPEGFGLCALANGEGLVKVVPINTPTAAVDQNLFQGKVHSLSWALRGYEELLLLASGPGGVVACLEISAAPTGKAIFVKERCRYLLPPSKQRWHTCSAFLPPGDFLVCGDRRGSVLLFPARPCLFKKPGVGPKAITAAEAPQAGSSSGGSESVVTGLGPVSSLHSLHGKQGVTSVTCHGGYVYSTGRDGSYYQLFVHGGRLQPVLRQKACRGMNWIAGLRMAPDGSMVVLGFHANEFVVWSPRSHEKLHIVNCGGGHRSWAFSDTEAAMAFAYLKDGDVMLYRALGGCIRPNVILREGLHGREITCVKRVGTVTLGPEFEVPNLEHPDSLEPGSEGPGLIDIVITGSEDTTVCVLALPTTTGAAHALTAVCNHISSVRALAVWGVGTPGGPQDSHPGLTAQVVSAGGRAEMHCFSLMITPDASTPSRLACHIMHLSSHRLDEYWDRQRNRHRMIKVDPETRYMSLAICELDSDRPGLGPGPLVAAACSDGAVRLFLLQDSGRILHLLAETFHHKRCVLKVHSFTHEAPNQRRRLILCSAATDGSIAFWDLTTAMDRGSTTLEPPAHPGLPYQMGTPCLTVQAHSCGVNSLHTLPTPEGHHLVASGSEDGSLHVFTLAVKMPELEEADGEAELVPQLCVLDEYSVPCAHAAHVTGIKILSPKLMVSASIDQRLTFWRLGNGEPTFMNSTVYHVPDVADMDCWPVNPEFGHRCALAGQGLEVYNWYD
ncbi:rCG25584 [Rattus norvegicus]|uniref:tRNA (34-2'-O)-methyltransferase regulator WDR6 n=1 Tax=Rattus norvegicus TaxID=10116 RepID=WDR6_RAT|nr:tRNA (34-2'-O)-methyltransferase regulator WDR6 [Rattus norvegicus]Q5XFW6.2 RecName: Full=tRNA (34-2'-O)-methyltransferase regulator WDR6; AltName: Full=WD repeat-containing protein 6 [Rattus norvegicus]EDL77156.1 rCG25584 [Rattus norvegicus]|eukprot:NP_001006989.2 WD repeat-containing protein 6 [Rattus norvegicus]